MENILEVCLLLIIVAMILMTWYHIEITEPMKTLALMVVSAFFGQKMPWGLPSKKDSNGA